MRIGHLQFDSQSLGIALAAVVGVVVALVVIRRLLGWALGPVFVFETTRLARKGHTFWLRVAFALGMLGLLYAVAPSEDDVAKESGHGVVERVRGSMGHYYDYPSNLEVRSAAMRQIMARFAAEFSNAFL